MFQRWSGRSTSGAMRAALRERQERRAQRRRQAAFWPGLEGLEGRLVLSFATPTSFLVASNLSAPAVGDVNNDGTQDVVTVNGASVGAVNVLLGNGNGAFQPAVSSPDGSTPSAVTLGDFNGDGKLDAATVSTGGLLNVLMGNGDGTFGAPVSYNAPGATHVSVGDFNGDGHLDLTTSNPGFNTVSIFTNNGDGTFAPKYDIAVGLAPVNVKVADFNNDGHADIVVPNQTSLGTISVLLGNGDGSFQASKSSDSFVAPFNEDVGDFNHDGKMDVAVCNSYTSATVTVDLGNGDGTFEPPISFSPGSQPEDVEVGDFNDDGNPDLIERGGGGVEMQRGRGDGTFEPSITFANNVIGNMAVADFNGDGVSDAVGACSLGVSVLANPANNAGAVALKVTIPAAVSAGSAVPMTVSAVDASGNVVPGFLGSVYLTSSDPQMRQSSFYYAFTAADAGTHSFANAMSLSTLGPQTITVAAPGLSSASGTIDVTPAAARLAVSMPTSATAGASFSITVTALDAAGNIVPDYTGTVHFASSDLQAVLPTDTMFSAADGGSRTFTATLKTASMSTFSVADTAAPIGNTSFVSVAPAAASSIVLSGGAGPVGVARFVSIIAKDPYGNTATGYNGTVHFTSSDTQAVLPANTTLTNGTGSAFVKFITVGSETLTATDTTDPTISGTETVVTSPAALASFQVTGYPATVAGTSNTFTVTVLDTLGRVMTNYTGTVLFSSSDFQAGLPASYTFTAADAGVHTFSATLKTAGTQSISARDAFNASVFGTDAGITVTPSAATSITMTGPLTATAGVALSVTVTARDAYGNIARGYTGKLHFTTTDAQGVLPADYSFTAADAGVHVFSVTLKTANLESVTVKDTANSLLTSTLSGINVGSNVATQLSVQAPSKVTAGTPFSLKVIALDAYGNEASTYAGTIHFSINVAGVTLPVDYTFTSADKGTHIFSITSNVAGNQTITIADIANASLKASVTISVATGSTTATGGGGGGGGTGGGGTGGGGTGGGGGGGGGTA